ncbi:MAG: hypothetical protein RJA63_71 [Pseudomonadota bacterium]
MNQIILVILLSGGTVDSVSMQQFQSAEACEAAATWLVAEQYTTKARGSSTSISWRCFRGDWKPAAR